MIKDFDSYPCHLKEFAHYKLTVEGCSERTVSEYLSDMRTFCRYLVARRGGLSLSAEDLMKVDISGLDMKFFENLNEEELPVLATSVAIDLARDLDGNEILCLKNFLSHVLQTLSFLSAQRLFSKPEKP